MDLNNLFLTTAVDFKNSVFMYVIAILVISFIAFQAVFFLIKALKQAKKIGISKDKIKKTILSSAIFSIAPSIAILLTVITLAGSLGLPFPWIRLNVIGALTYELPAAMAVVGKDGSLVSFAASKLGFSTVTWVMTLGIMLSLVLVLFFIKKIQRGVNKIKEKDNKWAKIFMDALFLGLISAFLGSAISGVTTDRNTAESIPATSGTIMVSVFTLISSALIMVVCGILVKKCKMKWLEQFALPLCMIISMGLAILYSNILPSSMF